MAPQRKPPEEILSHRIPVTLTNVDFNRLENYKRKVRRSGSFILREALDEYLNKYGETEKQE